MKTLLLLCSLLPSDADTDAAAALALAAAALHHPKAEAVYDDYAAAYAKAIKDEKPLLVWVGQKPCVLQGTVACYQPTLKGYPATCVVVSRRDARYWLATLEGVHTQNEVLDVLDEEMQSLHGKSAGEAASGAAPVPDGGPARVLSSSGPASLVGSVPTSPVGRSRPARLQSAPPVIRGQSVGRSC